MSARLRGFGAALLVALAAACSIDPRAVTVDSRPVDPGDGGQAIELCQGILVQHSLIADFSDAVEKLDPEGNVGIQYPSGPVNKGGISYLFAAPGLDPPRLSIQTTGDNRALRIDATPGVPVDNNYYFGFALGFGSDQEVCIDATGYSGVGFTLDGSVGTCQLMFQVMISQDDRVGGAFAAASCTVGELCYPPFSDPLAVEGPGSYAIPFAALAHDGNPVPGVDLKTITNVGWKMFAPLDGVPCEAHLVLDDVAFFR